MKAVYFDLDNTLYDAKKYYLGAFQDIANFLHQEHSINKEEAYNKLVEFWIEKTSMYSHLFDDLVTYFNITNESVKTFVKIFNEYKIENNQLYSDSIPTLKKLKNENYKIGIITDGNITRQKRKIMNYGLDELVDVIVYTKTLEPKPSKLPFIEALNKIDIKPSKGYYVADNPRLDFKGAKDVGIKTIRILRGEFMKVPSDNSVNYTISNLKELWEVLEK